MKLGRYRRPPGEGKNSQASNLFSQLRLYKPAKRGLASPVMRLLFAATHPWRSGKTHQRPFLSH